MVWTQFMDMHSGGRKKEPHQFIYIELPRNEAEWYFMARFGHDPDHVTCQCCGSDYSVNEHESLEEATAYERGCDWDYREDEWNLTTAKITLEDYCAGGDVLIIRASEIPAHTL